MIVTERLPTQGPRLHTQEYPDSFVQTHWDNLVLFSVFNFLLSILTSIYYLVSSETKKAWIRCVKRRHEAVQQSQDNPFSNGGKDGFSTREKTWTR